MPCPALYSGNRVDLGVSNYTACVASLGHIFSPMGRKGTCEFCRVYFNFVKQYRYVILLFWLAAAIVCPIFGIEIFHATHGFISPRTLLWHSTDFRTLGSTPSRFTNRSRTQGVRSCFFRFIWEPTFYWNSRDVHAQFAQSHRSYRPFCN